MASPQPALSLLSRGLHRSTTSSSTTTTLPSLRHLLPNSTSASPRPLRCPMSLPFTFTFTRSVPTSTIERARSFTVPARRACTEDLSASRVWAAAAMTTTTTKMVPQRPLGVRRPWVLRSGDGVSRRPFSTSGPCRATTRESLMDVTGFAGTTLLDVREAVGKVCEGFGDDYWAERDESGEYPFDFHSRLAADGWIGIALPEHLGGAGLGISEATMMLETISESGAGMAGSQSIHANVYATQPVAKFGTPSQLQTFLPPLIKGTSRVCFGVTEPNTGLDTLKLKTLATKSPDGASYSITGQKIWISSAQVASHMILLARTTPLSEVATPSSGLSLFLIPLDESHRGGGGGRGRGLSLRRIPKMGARAIDANEVFFDNYTVPRDCLVGTEGHGFDMVLHGLNAERCLLAGEALGLGYAALEKAARYARERVVFGRAIGMNQGVAHPLAECWMGLEAAKGATFYAAGLYDRSVGGGGGRKDAGAGVGTGGGGSGGSGGGDGGEEKISLRAVGVACNTAKYLAAEAAFKACERAVLTLGGMGYAKEYHVERYLRECFIPRIAPVSREMVLNFIGEKVLGLPRSY